MKDRFFRKEVSPQQAPITLLIFSKAIVEEGAIISIYLGIGKHYSMERGMIT